MGDDVLKKIAHELVDSVRRNATLDWNEKEQVRARMRAAIRRLLTRYGYPPDKQPAAIELVMHQAELLARAA
jgi:type I restriction enzyme R subunit